MSEVMNISPHNLFFFFLETVYLPFWWKSAEEQLTTTQWWFLPIQWPERWGGAADQSSVEGWALQSSVGNCWIGTEGTCMPSDQSATSGWVAVNSGAGALHSPCNSSLVTAFSAAACSSFSWFQLVLHPAWHFAWCAFHISWISRVTIYSLDILLSQFWTSPLFYVWF